MCDWEAGEYAEYLLWVEAAKARARVRARPSLEESPRQLGQWYVPPSEPVEA